MESVMMGHRESRGGGIGILLVVHQKSLGGPSSYLSVGHLES